LYYLLVYVKINHVSILINYPQYTVKTGTVVVVIVWGLDLQLSMQSVLWVWIPLMARCTRYNIMWSSLSVTCGRSVVFFGYSGFLHQ